MRNTRWLYRKSNSEKNSNLNIDRDIISLLHSRGITSDEEIYSFINTSINNIGNPFSLKDVDIAVNAIIEAIKNKDNIWIYGDYDVDGITSTSLFYLALSELGTTPQYYIPLRDEGYGLNKDAMKYIAENGGKLIITVDCGISSHEEINYANELGLKIIVTDHHEINNGNPPALAVINPKRPDNIFTFKYLAGVGTAFMVLYALYTKLNRKDEVFKFLDIVSIGTVADIVPLIEENRIFTKMGMEQLKHSSSLGVKMLIKKLFEDYNTQKISTYDIGFIIAPIFNAAGRLEDAKKAVELFIEKDHVKCTQLINELLNNNSERRTIQDDIFTQAVNIIEEQKLYENTVIVVAKEHFHHGVIGIVASKILDRYYKPTIIMEIKKDEGVAVASCRSIEGFNMIEAIDKFSDLLLKYGGHAGAAGFSIKIENIKEFSDKLNDYARSIISEYNLIRPIKIDISIPSYKISYDFINKLSTLEPFGFGNPSPVFSLTNCDIYNTRAIGQEKNHLMFNVKKDNVEIRNCVWFNTEDVFQDILNMSKVDIAFKLKLETYKDRYQYKMYVEDVQPATLNENSSKQWALLYDTIFPVEVVVYTRRKIDANTLNLVYHDGEVDLTINRSYLTTLDNQTSYVLSKLQKYYNYSFQAKIKDIILKDENYNIHVIIDKNYTFTSYSIRPAELFNEIKQFLIGDFPYNHFQKSALASIFKKKSNTLAISEKNRGINTIIQTVALFYKNIGKKVLCITDELLPPKTLNMVDVNPEYKDGYDFYIWINPKGNILTQKPTLIFSNKGLLELDSNFSIIQDEITIPKNVVFIDDDSIYEKENIFSKKLPIQERISILKNLHNFSVLYSTRDILIYI